VDPNPRPPNEPKYGLRQNQPAGSRIGVSGNQKAHAGIGVAKNKALKTKANGGATPAASSPTGGGSTVFAQPVDPRDSQYWRDLAQLNFNKDIGLQRFGTEDVQDKIRNERELADRKYQDPREVQHLREGANVGGRIYSTATQEDLGNLAQQQFQAKAGIEEAYRNAIANRAMERNELTKGYNLGVGNIYSEAVDRALAKELERAGPEEGVEGFGDMPLGGMLKSAIKKRSATNSKKNNKKNSGPSVSNAKALPKKAGVGNAKALPNKKKNKK
jgi:hypothetical protein